jgi:DNA repair protein RecN (Recombination protein N)
MGSCRVLTQINIQGLAIIDQLAIEFSQGFNVITGETGAGKSILIKALGLLLGAKASAETVRRGRDAAVVSGLFDVPEGHKCTEVLAHYGVPFEVDSGHFPIIIRRQVTSKGRSLAWINDLPVTASVLKDLAASLIDVFGQHDNLRLLDPAMHALYLDQFLPDRALGKEYLTRYQALTESLAELTAMVDDFRAKRRDADYLEFRCEELRKFGPERDDYERVQSLCKKAGSVLNLANALEKAQKCIDEGAGGDSLSTPLFEAAKVLGKLEHLGPEFKGLAEEAATLAARADDLSFAIGRAVSGTELDEGDLESAQERLAGYQVLFRKLAVADIEHLLAERDRLEGELAFIQSAAADVLLRVKALKAKVAELKILAGRLTKARTKAKDVVKKRIEAELHELAMAGAAIDIEFTPVARTLQAMEISLFGEEVARVWAEVADELSELGETGAERAQFLLAANQGEAMLPLHKIASGGEVSRIMLALKKGLAAGADTCILVFDEIDTGISGRVADVVGRKMQELSEHFQVICISHLAQVSAYADTHFLVHKFGKDKRTESTITKLAQRDREEEVARLLSGEEVTETSLANARNLIQRAKSKPSIGAPKHADRSPARRRV